MTLPGTVFFPQVVLPLHIFEPRYREMLGDVLTGDRIFAVASLDTETTEVAEDEVPAHPIATAGIIRGCQANSDGTSDLLLQGLCRIAFIGTVTEAPYRIMETRLLTSVPGGSPQILESLKRQLVNILKVKSKLGVPLSCELLACLEQMEEPEAIVDLAAYAMCPDPGLRQSLLETLNTRLRLERMLKAMRRDVWKLRMAQKLQGCLDDDEIENN